MSERQRPVRDTDRIYLCAPINALVEGIYEEHIPLAEILRHGDFGLGTFDHLDGEMVIVDGRAFHIGADGGVDEVDETALTPFAAVVSFQPDMFHASAQAMDDPAFSVWLEGLLPSPNLLYAFRIQGRFSYIKARSVPKSECYLPLVQVAKVQSVFEFHDIEGVLAGFYTPSFMGSVSVPGMHLHFLSDDFQHGGHLLECRPTHMEVAIQTLHTLELSLPSSQQYLQGDLTRDISSDLAQAEN